VFTEVKEVFESIGIKCGRDKFFDIMRAAGLLIRPKKTRVHTTDSSAWMRQFDDLRKDFTPTGPDQLWASDITYIACEEHKLYLSLITDEYSRQIMGWELHSSLHTSGPLLALQRALARRAFPRNRIIHHSDRGCQYVSRAYVRTLRRNGLKISTTQSGSPYENPLAESVNGQLKVEYDLDHTFKTKAAAINAVQRAVQQYNEQRPHGSLNMLKPCQVHYEQIEASKATIGQLQKA
jgi:transposase InsO family protein